MFFVLLLMKIWFLFGIMYVYILVGFFWKWDFKKNLYIMYLFRYIECMEIYIDGMKLIVYVI